jgi:hypothetical protein
VRRRGIVLCGLLLLGAVPATAAEIAVPAEVRAGALALRVPPGPLDRFQVADATGSGTGWRVSAALHGGEAPPGAAVTGVRFRTLAGSPPTNAVAYPVALLLDQPVPIASAAPGTGMGTTELAPMLDLGNPDADLMLELTLTAGP